MEVVRLDEKWFYLTLNKHKYYLLNEEGAHTEPQRVMGS